MQSRPALTLMPWYKLKVFSRLRYMIIIGYLLFASENNRDKEKKMQVCKNTENSFWKYQFR